MPSPRNLAIAVLLAALATAQLTAQQDQPKPATPEQKEAQRAPEADEPVPPAQTGPGPTFTVADKDLGKHPSIIAYGDMRFHDPTNFSVANPHARVALVKRIAEEKPDAVQLSGDVPYKGSDYSDYDQYRLETAAWRDAGLRIYPAIGNHELALFTARGYRNWWKAFPELNEKKWYSVALGSRVYLIQLDSNSDLHEGKPQQQWLDEQLKSLPKSVDFVLITLHHPPVADIQQHIEVSHNPRPNEVALRDFLIRTQATLHAQIMVTAGHIHNYERTELGGITWLVSGGGGAKPYVVERTPQDLYQDPAFPNFHYVKLQLEKDKLKATMYRLADPEAATPEWQEKDHFEIKRRP